MPGILWSAITSATGSSRIIARRLRPAPRRQHAAVVEQRPADGPLIGRLVVDGEHELGAFSRHGHPLRDARRERIETNRIV